MKVIQFHGFALRPRFQTNADVRAIVIEEVNVTEGSLLVPV